MNELGMTSGKVTKELTAIALEVAELQRELDNLPSQMESAAKLGLANRIEDLKFRRLEIPQLLRALEIRSLGLRISLKEFEINETKQRADIARNEFEFAVQRLQEIHKQRVSADEVYRSTQAQNAILHNSVTVQEGDLNRMRDELQKLVAEEFKSNERAGNGRRNEKFSA